MDMRNQLETLANAGCTWAMIELGDKNLYEKAISSDGVEKALVWYQKAADCGDPIGLHRLARIYYNGHFVKQNYGKALLNFRLITLKNQDMNDELYRIIMIDSMFHLGEIYCAGNCGEDDMRIGMEWMKKAADLGDPAAKAFLVMLKSEQKNRE